MKSCLRPVGITGMGSYAPPQVVTNADLEKLVDTTDEWITTRSGIKERHKAPDDMATSDLGLQAAKIALENAGVKPEEIELIIFATVSPDKILPSTACILQDKLGCVNAAAFDLMAGCTGFVYGLSVASQMVATGAYNKVLVVGADILTKLVDWEDRNTCVLFGDGGGAAVVEPVEEGYGILGHTIGAEGSGHIFIELPAGATFMPATHQTIDDRMHYIKMQGREVFKFAVNIMNKATRDVVEKAGITLDDIDLVIPHQANIRIIEAAAKRLKLQNGRVFSNLHKFGNTSAGTIPLALVDAMAEGKIHKGDTIILVGFGAGLTYGAMLMKWAYEPKVKAPIN